MNQFARMDTNFCSESCLSVGGKNFSLFLTWRKGTKWLMLLVIEASKVAQMSTRWFILFSFKTCGIQTPNFLTLPLECKCYSMVDWPEFIVVASCRLTDVDHELKHSNGLNQSQMVLLNMVNRSYQNAPLRNEKTIFTNGFFSVNDTNCSKIYKKLFVFYLHS